MARIPTVEEPSVRTEGLPTPYQRPIATPQGQGAGFGDVLQGAARVASEYVEDAKDQANIAAMSGATGDGKTIVNVKVRDPNPNGVGYARLQGKDAMDARDKTIETVNESLDEVSAKLTPEQQQMFAPRLQALKEEAFSHIIDHESTQRNRYAQGLYQGNADATTQEMQMPDVLGDPAKLQEKRRDLLQNGINRAKDIYGQNASKETIQSVVVPEMQKAALGTMQEALRQAEQADDPTIAQKAFDVLGKDLIASHQKQIGGMVEALTAKVAIKQQAQSIIGGAATSIPTPDGPSVARIDATQVASKVADLSPDTKYLPEIEKAVEARQQRLGNVWKGAVGRVYERAEGAAMNGGGFDLDRASPIDIEWLRVNAPDDLRKLQREDATGTKAQSTKESHDAYSALVADMTANGDTYKNMDAQQFYKLTVDQGIGALDRVKAIKLFKDVQKAGLSETINKTASQEIVKAMPDDTDARKQLQGQLLDATSDFVQRWRTGTGGKLPTTEEIRKFIDAELVTGKVQGTGLLYWDRATRLEYQLNQAYRGKSFEPLDVNAPTVPQVPPRAGAPVAGAIPAQPRRPTRTVNGVTKEWDGTKWVTP